MTKLKKPTDAMIRAGYYMMRARENFLEYGGEYDYALQTAIDAVLEATDELMANDGMYRNEASAVLKLLYKAQHVQIQYREGTGRTVPLSVMNQHAEEIGDAHFTAGGVIMRYGYRLPNKREFAALGFGGGR